RLDPHTDKRMIEDNLERCSSLIASGSEHELLCDLHFFPMTPKRYMSLISPHTNEDQFRYGDDPPFMPHYQAIRVPMLVMFAQYDEYADRPIEEIQSVFDTVHQSSSYVSIILPCFHNFHGFEQECVDHIVSWVKNIL
ncbi:MAG: hypothetical protein N3A54_06515, partial [Patescibacteria group bacterium]|nr:hypothetical protein [Patescibacteria group bacterium]